MKNEMLYMYLFVPLWCSPALKWLMWAAGTKDSDTETEAELEVKKC